jgi:hypothetical protein
LDAATPVVLHVGFTKAASTTLQAFFHGTPSVQAVDGDRAAILLSSKNAFLFDREEFLAFLRPELEAANRTGRTVVISHERLTGNPHSGHYDCKELAERLHDLFPAARVVISIREQMRILASAYKQYVRIGGVKTLRDYLMPVWDCRLPLFDWSMYKYTPLVRLYFDLFGRPSVLVPLVEELERDPQAYFRRLAEFMGITPSEGEAWNKVQNPGIPDEQIERRRLRNFFSPDSASIKDPHPLQGRIALKVFDWISPMLRLNGYGPDRTIVDAVRELFAGRYAESNRELSALISKDLASFGYEVP